jgi:hypothetical protein
MTEHHHFVQHVLREGDGVVTEFICTADERAECRQYCKTCQDEEREQCQCDYVEIAQPDGTFIEGREPEYHYGSCNYLGWTEDAPEELYNGERAPVRGPEPQPIVFEWTGDYYCWDYAP